MKTNTGSHLPFVIAQQLDISFIRTAVPWHTELSREDKEPTPCIVWGRKRANMMHLYFLV